MTLRRRLKFLVAILAIAGVAASYWVFKLNVRHMRLHENAISDSLFRSMLVAFISAVAALLVVVALVWIYLEHYVIDPLEELRNELRLVAGGSLHQVIEVHKPDEIMRAAQDAESMRRNLVAQIDKAREATQGLDDQAPLVVHMRQALAANPSISQHPNLDIAGVTHPARGMISGDWWDCVDVPGGVALTIVDVMGHGPQAGITGLQIKSIVNAGLASGIPLVRIVERVSKELAGTDDLLASMFIVIIPDAETYPMKWINAGHPAGLLHVGTEVIALESSGPILGALAETWEEKETAFDVGSRLVLVSDGLIESRDSSGYELEVSGLTEIMDHLAHSASSEEACAVITSRTRQISSTWDVDDVTVVAVTRRLFT